MQKSPLPAQVCNLCQVALKISIQSGNIKYIFPYICLETKPYTSMKKILLLTAIITILLFIACGGNTPKEQTFPQYTSTQLDSIDIARNDSVKNLPMDYPLKNKITTFAIY